MFAHPKLKAIAAAAGALAALAAATPASAFVYSMASLRMTDLSLAVTGTTTTVDSFTFTLSNTAALNSAPVATGAACSNGACPAGPPVLDSGPANAVANTPGFNRTNNVFAPLGTDPAASYAGADNVINSAQLVAPFAAPTSIQQISEMLLNTNGDANANSEIQSTTNLSWTFTVGGGASIALTFMADPNQRVQIAGPAGSYSTQTNMAASFTLTDGAGDQVAWAPQGTLANNCTSTIVGVSCTESADGADLNRQISTAVNPNDLTNPAFGGGLVAFGINISGLAAGTYSIALNSLTSGNISRNVPEPGTVALLGLALTGMGFASRRRSTKA